VSTRCHEGIARERRVNRYYDPVTEEFITVDPLYSETSSAAEPQSPSQTSTADIGQAVNNYQLALISNQFGPSGPDLSSFSSINGLSLTTIGTGLDIKSGYTTTPNSVTSSDNPYAYADGDPQDGVDPTGLRTIRKVPNFGTVTLTPSRQNYIQKHLSDILFPDEEVFLNLLEGTLQHPEDSFEQQNGNWQFYKNDCKVTYYDIFGDTITYTYKFTVIVDPRTGEVVTAYANQTGSPQYG